MSNTQQNITWKWPDGEMCISEPQDGNTPTERSRDGNFQRISFLALWLFTLLLYARPSDLFPNVTALASVTKIIALVAVITFVVGKFTAPEATTLAG